MLDLPDKALTHAELPSDCMLRSLCLSDESGLVWPNRTVVKFVFAVGHDLKMLGVYAQRNFAAMVDKFPSWNRAVGLCVRPAVGQRSVWQASISVCVGPTCPDMARSFKASIFNHETRLVDETPVSPEVVEWFTSDPPPPRVRLHGNARAFAAAALAETARISHRGFRAYSRWPHLIGETG